MPHERSRDSDDEWSEFLDQFSRGHRAWLAVTGPRVQPDPHPSHRSDSPGPLAAVLESVPARRGSRRFGFSSIRTRTSPLLSKGPTSVAFASTQTAAALARSLEITDEEVTGGVRFGAAPLPEMLDGIAPGELSRPPQLQLRDNIATQDPGLSS